MPLCLYKEKLDDLPLCHYLPSSDTVYREYLATLHSCASMQGLYLWFYTESFAELRYYCVAASAVVIVWSLSSDTS